MTLKTIPMLTVALIALTLAPAYAHNPKHCMAKHSQKIKASVAKTRAIQKRQMKLMTTGWMENTATLKLMVVLNLRRDQEKNKLIEALFNTIKCGHRK